MAVDCSACGRTNVTFADSVDLCNRVHCSAFDHFRASVPKPEKLTPIGQSRMDSAIEVAVNILIGAAVSLAAQALIFPAYGIHVGAGAHLGIVAAFTVVSVARQYVLRRLFNGKSPYRFFREKFN